MKLKKLFFLKKFSELTKIKNNNIKNIKIETLSVDKITIKKLKGINMKKN